MKEKPLSQSIAEMRALGDFLVRYNYPKCKTINENDIACLKSQETMIDGYHLILSYSKSDFEEYFIESLQIYSRYSPFLPFGLICKIGKKFLGEKNLSFVDLFRDSRKYYCWSCCKDRQGNSVPFPHDIKYEDKTYNGLVYRKVPPSQFNFY